MDPRDDSEAGPPSSQNANQPKLTGSSVSDDSGYETLGDNRDQCEISNISDPPQPKTREEAEGTDDDIASNDVALLQERLEKIEEELKKLRGGE